MNSLLKKYRDHRIAARNARELHRAIVNAPSRTVRDELLIAAQRDGKY